MRISVSSSFGFTLSQPTDVLLQFEAADTPQQLIINPDTWTPVARHTARVPAHDNIGHRYWLRAEGSCRVDYSAVVEIDQQVVDIAGLDALSPRHLPGEAVQYLFDSRYCQSLEMQQIVGEQFGHLEGGSKIAAMRDWIYQNFTYAPGSSDAQTTAIQSLEAKQGICRDYAHVLVSMARASAIPARYVSCYAPGVTPPDFHAIAEVFLADPENPPSEDNPGGGTWQMVDATGMADPAKTAKIGVGRDAADVSFLTVFGASQFDFSSVAVEEVTD